MDHDEGDGDDLLLLVVMFAGVIYHNVVVTGFGWIRKRVKTVKLLKICDISYSLRKKQAKR